MAIPYRARTYHWSDVLDDPTVLTFLADNGCEYNHALFVADIMDPTHFAPNIASLSVLEDYNIPLWIEIETSFENTYYDYVITPETQPYDDTTSTVATIDGSIPINWPVGTSLPSFETMFGPAITAYNNIDSLQGYSIEGGFENGLIWLRDRCDSSGKEISSYGGGITSWNGLPGSIPPDWGAFNPWHPTPPYHFYTTHDMGWWYSRCDELVWCIYCLAAIPFVQIGVVWADTLDIRQGVNTIISDTGTTTWWSDYMRVVSEAYPQLTLIEQQRSAAACFWQLKQLMNSRHFSVTETNLRAASEQSIQSQAEFMLELNLTESAENINLTNIAYPT